MTRHPPDRARAAVLLTNRLVPLSVKPLTAREFWQLVDRVDPAELLHGDVDEIAARAVIDRDEATRLRTLLDAATALSFEQERLHDGGVTLLSALDARFPPTLRTRLGSACPPFLLVAGPIELLPEVNLGIVGSRDASDDMIDVARQAGGLAAAQNWPVVSGLARGVDQAAIDAAFDAGGLAIGVPAEGITRASRRAEIRRHVHAGELTIASPYAPDAPFSAGNAMGRNKIIYALSHVTFVAASTEGKGGTWSGATEAIDRRYARVAAWTGPGASDGNHALVRRGATPITDLAELFTLDPLPPEPRQHSLF